MILTSWSKLYFTKSGKVNGTCRITDYFNEVKCDTCGLVYIEKYTRTINSVKHHMKELCSKCRIPLGCAIAGKASSLTENKGRFTKERWSTKTVEEKYIHAKRANDGLQFKINNVPGFKDEYYKKIFQNSKIGFTSKGHNELHQFLEEYGFEQHTIISNMQVDECNNLLKIVVEYNGDMYHCNPRKWKPEQYNTAIKMTASEKWEKDRNRMWVLKKLGYITFVVWEEDWKANRDAIKTRLINFLEKRKNETRQN